jgi:hypothetical protein
MGLAGGDVMLNRTEYDDDDDGNDDDTANSVGSTMNL